MLQKTIVTTLIGLSFSTTLFAGTMGEVANNSFPNFYVGAYGGYGSIMGAYKHDGNFAQARLALGAYAKHFRQWDLGGEIGIQSGNTMRLHASPAVVNPATQLPPQATLKPLLDLLFTAKGNVPTKYSKYPVFYFLKGGIAYRQLQLNDRTSTYGDGTSNVTGECQAGLGYNFTEHVSLNAFYQGIYSYNNAGITLNSVGDTKIAHIPTQQAGFLGVEYRF